MWRHFDGLRQQKNSAFLSAQGFLIAAVAIAFQVHQSSHASSRLISGTAQQIAVGVSVFGLVLSLAWLALQIRNGKYIRFHQKEVRNLESALPGKRSTFDRQDEVVHKGRSLWKPSTWSSLTIDRFLPGVTITLWICSLAVTFEG
jgi:hypothetical protein